MDKLVENLYFALRRGVAGHRAANASVDIGRVAHHVTAPFVLKGIALDCAAESDCASNVAHTVAGRISLVADEDHIEARQFAHQP